MERFLKMGAVAFAFLAIVALAAMAFMVATADKGGGDGRDSGTPAPPAPAVAYDVYIPEVPAPDEALTESQIETVKAAVNSDERLNAALSGESFAVTKVGPWYGDEGLIGALVAIELDNPVSYTGSFPAVGFQPDGEGYITGEVAVQADGIESLEMLVDLDKRIVVDIYARKATGEVCLEYGKPQRFHGPLGGVDMMIWTLAAPKSPICAPRFPRNQA